MYVEGKKGISTFRVDFQANYQGKEFKVRFGSERESYIGIFNYEHTYDNPAPLKLDKLSGTGLGSSANIVDAIDFNITDNNLTKLFTTSDFRIKTPSGAYTSEFTPYSSDSGNRIEAYSMVDNSVWTRFDTANTISSSNTLTQFTSGRGYWVRGTSKLATEDNNYTKIGIITSSGVDSNDDEVYGKLNNGWHMLSFEESDLRYAPSGIYIPKGVYSGTNTSAVGGVRIYFTRHASTVTTTGQIRGNFIDSSKVLDLNTSDGNASNVGWTQNFTKAINFASIASRLLYGENVNMRAYPAVSRATSVDSNGTDGIIILADHLFEVNSSNSTIRTLAGSSLRSTSRGFYSSKFGEFILTATLNDVGGEDINASMGISMPKYSSTEEIVSDLNDTNRSALLSKIYEGLLNASKKSGSTVASTIADAYFINIDSNGSAYSSSNLTIESFPQVLMASGARFSITDKTTVKLFEFKMNGAFRVTGVSGSKDLTIALEDDNITRTINAINGVFSDTGIKARDLGNNYFMLSSSNGAITLLEDYNATLFEDIPLGSSLIDEGVRDLTRGSIKEVYSVRDLLDRRMKYDLSLMDGNISVDNNVSWDKLYDYNFTDKAEGIPDLKLDSPNLTNDLRKNAIWVIDFPLKSSLIQKFAKYGKEIVNISVQKFSHDNLSYYDFLDLTKNPDDWYGNTYESDDDLNFDNDYQGIFHIFANQNYCVKIRDKAPLPSSTKAISSDSSITYSARPTFNNTLKDGEGVTQNHISSKLNIKFDKLFINPLANDYYNVVAILGGTRYYLRDNGQYFSLDIDDLDMGLISKAPDEADDPIFINAYDGSGNILKAFKWNSMC